MGLIVVKLAGAGTPSAVGHRGDVDPAIGATDDGAQTQQQDFLQRIKPFSLPARVVQVGETLQALDWLIGTFGHLLVPPRTLQVGSGGQCRSGSVWTPPIFSRLPWEVTTSRRTRQGAFLDRERLLPMAEVIEAEAVLRALSNMSLDEIAGFQLAYNTAWSHEVPRLASQFKRIIEASPLNPDHSGR